VIYDSDPDLIFQADGAIEVLAGHKDPSIHLKMLTHDFAFDWVQMPLNCFDASFRSFEKNVLPEAARRGMAILGMKSLGGSGEMVRHGGVTAAEALRYAMSLPVSVTISGMESTGVLKQNLEVARGFQALSAAQMQSLRDRCRVDASDGRWELFKTTKKDDGDLGRQKHGFPPSMELPA
jgi:aryl-alcohol dehydrogenase-like predicted oxidoreductase